MQLGLDFQTSSMREYGRGVTRLPSATSIPIGQELNQTIQEEEKIVLQLYEIGTANGTMLNVTTNFHLYVKSGLWLRKFVL